MKYKMVFSWMIFLGGLLASLSMAQDSEFRVGDPVYLCLKRTLHPTWPEVFAVQVEVIAVLEKRYKVRVVNEFPMPGRTNEEEVPAKGDVMKISRNRVYSREQAGVTPGDRFQSKPVCGELMKEPDNSP